MALPGGRGLFTSRLERCSWHADRPEAVDGATSGGGTRRGNRDPGCANRAEPPGPRGAGPSDRVRGRSAGAAVGLRRAGHGADGRRLRRAHRRLPADRAGRAGGRRRGARRLARARAGRRAGRRRRARAARRDAIGAAIGPRRGSAATRPGRRCTRRSPATALGRAGRLARRPRRHRTGDARGRTA